MKTTRENTADKYILHVYKKRNAERAIILKEIIFPYREAFGKVTVNINDIFTEYGREELKNEKYFHLFTILGNINGRLAHQGLFFKSKEIQQSFLHTHSRLNTLSADISEAIQEIKDKHGKPKKEASVLSFISKTIY